MKNIIKLFTISVLLIALNGCRVSKPQTRTVYKFVQDSTHIETKRDIVLPVRHVTILESPCKNDSLIIPTQIIGNDKGSLKISAKNGQLVVEASLDSIVSVHVDKLSVSKDLEIKEVEVFIDKPYRDKWFWYSIIANIGLLIWILKKPIFGVIRKFFIPI